jgi:hypothetical protein
MIAFDPLPDWQFYFISILSRLLYLTSTVHVFAELDDPPRIRTLQILEHVCACLTNVKTVVNVLPGRLLHYSWRKYL